MLKTEIERRCYSRGLMWKSANLLLKSSRLVAEMTLLGSRFHRGMRDGKKVFSVVVGAAICCVISHIMISGG